MKCVSMGGVAVLLDLAVKDHVFADTEGYFPSAVSECAAKY